MTSSPATIDQPRLSWQAAPRWVLALGAFLLCFAWLRLVLHLRVIWSVDEQYSYGWAVPFLCGLLLWRRWQSWRSPFAGESTSADLALGVGFATVFIGARLIEEANPDWRLIGWALALSVIGLTCIGIKNLFGRSGLRHFSFPIAFFLVAVPWPTAVEQPLIQVLTRGIVGLTAEVLNTFGHPAIAQGNIIETAGGFVNVDEACSGIRSLQAALMLSLFFGEWRRLNVSRRMALIGIAFALASVFNLGRTLLLSFVAIRQGTAAVEQWHDPAGVTILLGCFAGVWAAATWLARKQSSHNAAAQTAAQKPRNGGALTITVLACASVMLAGEVGVRSWYASAPKTRTAQWSAEFPTKTSSYKQVELPAVALKILRYDEGASGTWQNQDGTRWQMIYLRWQPGRVASTLARNHTPEICLPAAGRNVRAVHDVAPIPTATATLAFRAFATEQNGRTLHVFYTLWEDGVTEQRNATEYLTWQARLNAVRERRINRGQRVLQIGLWGARDSAHAEELLRAELPHLIRPS